MILTGVITKVIFLKNTYGIFEFKSEEAGNVIVISTSSRGLAKKGSYTFETKPEFNRNYNQTQYKITAILEGEYNFKQDIIDGINSLEGAFFTERKYEASFGNEKSQDVILKLLSNVNWLKDKINLDSYSLIEKQKKYEPFSFVALRCFGFDKISIGRMLRNFGKKSTTTKLIKQLNKEDPGEFWKLDIEGDDNEALDRLFLLKNGDPRHHARIKSYFSVTMKQIWSGGDELCLIRTKPESILEKLQQNTNFIATLKIADVEGFLEDAYAKIIKDRDFLEFPKIKKMVRRTTTRKLWEDVCQFSNLLTKDCEEIEIDEWLKTYTGVMLSEEQTKAVASVFKNKVTVITGGPGTGKTTIVKAIVDYEPGTLLLTPTGKAARRLGEKTNTGAMTIHKAAGENWGNFKENHEDEEYEDFETEKILFKILVIDESSMINRDILGLLNFIITKTGVERIVLVGDVDQLPPIGAGGIFGDIISYLGEYCVIERLTKIFRQSEEKAMIPLTAKRIKHGKVPELDDKIVSFVETSNDNETLNILFNLYDKSYDPYTEFQIMCPQNKGNFGNPAVNKIFREKLGMVGNFCQGDKVIHIENNDDLGVFNGEVGKISEFFNDQFVVKFDDRFVTYERNKWRFLDHAWSITIHKMQGSETKLVIIPFMEEHRWMWTNTPGLLYTAITRASEKVILVGNRDVFVSACQNGNLEQYERKTIMWYLENSGLKKEFMERLSETEDDEIDYLRERYLEIFDEVILEKKDGKEEKTETSD